MDLLTLEEKELLQKNSKMSQGRDDTIIEPDFIEADAPMVAGAGSADEGFQDSASRGTLDETVLKTLKRDVVDINSRLKQVVYPHFPSLLRCWCGGLGAEDTGSSAAGQRHLSQLRPVGPASIHHTVRAVRVARAVAVLESVRVELVHPAGDGAAPEAHQAAPEGVADLLHIHLRVLPVPAGAERAALASATTAGVPHRRAEPLGRAGSVPPETGGHGAVPDVVRGGCRMGSPRARPPTRYTRWPSPFRHSLALHYSIGLN